MKKGLIILGLVMVMVLGTTYVYAQGMGMFARHRGMPESFGPEKAYPLSPEQKTKLQELVRKFRDENAKLIGSIVTKRMELQSLWSNPKADSKAILDKEKELRDLQNQFMDKITQMRLEVRNFLTPEQIENWRIGHGLGLKGPISKRGHATAIEPRIGPPFGHGMCY